MRQEKERERESCQNLMGKHRNVYHKNWRQKKKQANKLFYFKREKREIKKKVYIGILILLQIYVHQNYLVNMISFSNIVDGWSVLAKKVQPKIGNK